MCKATPPLCYAGHHQSAMLLGFDQVYRHLYFVIIDSAIKSGLIYPSGMWLILFINPSSSKCLKREPFFKDIGFSRFCLKPLSKFCFFYSRSRDSEPRRLHQSDEFYHWIKLTCQQQNQLSWLHTVLICNIGLRARAALPF